MRTQRIVGIGLCVLLGIALLVALTRKTSRRESSSSVSRVRNVRHVVSSTWHKPTHDAGSIPMESQNHQATTDSGQVGIDLDGVVNEVASADLPAKVEHLHNLTNTDSNKELFIRFVQRWAEADVAAAADWTRRLPASSARQESITTVAIAWANQDLPAAAAWVHLLPEGTDRQSALKCVAYEAVRTDPLEALTLAGELTGNSEREGLITDAAAQWAATDPRAAADWAKQFAAGPFRGRLLAMIATAWGESDPVAAATFAVTQLPDGRPKEDAVIGILQRWVQQQPEEAAAWVAEFPDGPLRQTALENVAMLGALRDRQQAGQ